MARIRLVRFQGNLAPMWQEGPLDRALAACPPAEPWCAIARADWELWMPRFLGADPAHVEALLDGSPLSGPAEARRVQARGDPAGVRALAGMDPTSLDGVGRGMVATGRVLPPAADTWFVGAGVAVVPGGGVVGQARFVHPDLGWRRHVLVVAADGTTLGGGGVTGSTRLATPGRPGLLVSVARSPLYHWDPDPTLHLVDTAGGVVTGGWGAGAWDFRVGWAGRADHHGGLWTWTHGPTLNATWSSAPWRHSTTLTAQGGDYPYLYAESELSGSWTRGRFELRGRLAAEAASPDAPFWRLPSAGGEALLRGEPAGRWRGPTLAATQVEARGRALGPVHAAVFVDLAAVDGLHWSAGAGLRLVLPPERWNVTRLDLGFAPGRWGVVLAWGEAW